ncbi:MAG: EamA/RhaT family transporter, partial [Pseudomonadota bacterium]
GALLILRPAAESFTPAALMPIAAGLTYAATILVTRRYCRAESPVTLAFGVAIGFFSVGVLGVLLFALVDAGPAAEAWPYIFSGWRATPDGLLGGALPALGTLALIAVCSLLNLTANLSLTRAYQTGESSWLAPFDYSYLAFAALWTLVMFGEAPDAPTWLGMALIGGAGLFIAWRERVASSS